MPIFRMGELFCGAGGLALGAINASIDSPNYKIIHQWASDIDTFACRTYAKNICPTNRRSVICKDVRELNINSLTQYGEIDCFAFGFPCNDFSLVGKQKGTKGKYGQLYKYGVEVLNLFKPKFFVAENVSGLSSANNGSDFQKILKDFKKCGYKLFPHLYKFEDYGIPQTRHRIIIVGIREDLPYSYFPPSPKAYQDIDNTCRTALEIPLIRANAYNNEIFPQSEIVTKRLSYIKQGENAFTADLPVELKLNIKGARLSNIYKRLNANKPSCTVTASGGGGTYLYHYDEPRALTNRERARLQTFPDDFRFYGSLQSVRKQIGMAVPPKGSQIIFEAILKTFAREPYDYILCNIG